MDEGHGSAPGRFAAGDEPDATSTRAAAGVFAVCIAAAGPLLLLVLGNFYWFMRDDWFFITDRQLDSTDDLFADHNGHWSTLPIVVFRVLWALVGIRSYVPYQAVVVGLHLGLVVLVRVVMRRAGVGPWLATAAASALVLLGAGREDIIWAFQIGLTGAVFFAVLQLVLADHEGPVGRRDAAGLVAGTLAIGSSGSAVPVVVATAVTLLARRGWRRAALHTGPLALAYLAWVALIDPQVGSPLGRPDLSTAADWVSNAYQAVFLGLGRNAVVAWALGAVLLVGLALQVIPPSRDRLEALRAGAGPLALLAAGMLFTVMTWQSRWFVGAQGARASRYVYVGAVLVTPALGMAANEIARRWRPALPVLAALLVVGVPANVAAFDDPPFGPAYHAHNEAVVRAAVRVPAGSQAAPSARPLPDIFVSRGLDMGFLRQAVQDGKLEPSRGPIPRDLAAELEVRLTLEQRAAGAVLEDVGIGDLEELATRCTSVEPDQHLRPEAGSTYLWDASMGGILLRPTSGDPATPVPVDVRDGAALVARRGGETFDWEPMRRSAQFSLCQLR